MTTKDWEAFREYREAEINRIANSKEYILLTERMEELTLRKHGFFDLFGYEGDSELFELYDFHRLELFKDVPDETVEECLSWLVQNKNEKNKNK